MIRKQIYLEEEQDKKLNLEAARRKTPVSSLIRLAIDLYLERKSKNADWDNDPLTRGIGSVSLNVDDASLNHDKYIYPVREVL